MNHVLACILALFTLRTRHDEPFYARQLRTEGGETRAAYLAQQTHDVARLHGVRSLLFLSLLWHEAAFDRDRISSVGCVSISQLCGAKKTAYLRACAAMRNGWACDAVAMHLGASELAHGLKVCGTEAGAVSFYRFGHCGGAATWRVRQVVALADELSWGMP